MTAPTFTPGPATMQLHHSAGLHYAGREPLTMDAIKMRDLQARAAEALSTTLRAAGADEVDLFWSTIDRASTGRLWLIAPDGAETFGEVPLQLGGVLPALRDAMYQDEKGTWLTARVRVNARGQYKFDFDYERRPYWHKSGSPYDPPEDDALVAPTDDAFVADLNRYPRTADFIPSWYPVSRARSESGLGDRSLAVSGPIGDESILAADAGWTAIDQALRAGIARAVDRLPKASVLENPAERESISSTVAQQAVGVVLELPQELLAQAWDAAVQAGLIAHRAARPEGEVLLEDLGDAITRVADDHIARVVAHLTDASR